MRCTICGRVKGLGDGDCQRESGDALDCEWTGRLRAQRRVRELRKTIKTLREHFTYIRGIDLSVQEELGVKVRELWSVAEARGTKRGTILPPLT